MRPKEPQASFLTLMHCAGHVPSDAPCSSRELRWDGGGADTELPPTRTAERLGLPVHLKRSHIFSQGGPAEWSKPLVRGDGILLPHSHPQGGGEGPGKKCGIWKHLESGGRPLPSLLQSLVWQVGEISCGAFVLLRGGTNSCQKCILWRLWGGCSYLPWGLSSC